MNAGATIAPVASIREALGYLARFRGHLFVIKIDDQILESSIALAIVQDIVLMQRMGIQTVVVAGARRAIDRALERAGLRSTSYLGTRVTTREMLAHVIPTVASLSTRVMSLFSECGGHAASGNWVRARSLGVVDGVDYDRSGRVERVDVDLLRALLDRDVVPVVTTVGWNSVGTAYSLVSGELALAVAAGMSASKLFIVTDAPGIRTPAEPMEDGPEVRETAAFSAMSVETAVALESSEVALRDSERALLRLAIAACRQGVDRVHVVDGAHDGVLLQEIFSAGGNGTMVHANRFAAFGAATPRDVPSIMSLLQTLVEDGLVVPRTAEAVGSNLTDWVVYRVDDAVHGCAGLNDLGEGDAELIGVAVIQASRSTRVGHRLVELALERARDRGATRVFVLTTQAIDFFQRFGFQDAPVQALPPARRSGYDPARASRILMIDPRQPLTGAKTER